MAKCFCYTHDDHGVDRCSGSYRCAQCTCGGDPRRCDFYPEKKEEAWHKYERRLALEAAILCLVDSTEYKNYDIFTKFDRESMENQTIGYHESAVILCEMIDEMEADNGARHS